MATPTTIPPYQASTGGTATPAATPSVPTSTLPATPALVPSGPNANALDPAIANKLLPGGGIVGAQAAQPAKPYTEKQLVEELATALGVKATKAKPLEIGVVDALASKYGVHLGGSGLTTEGTGTGQGNVGQARHFIASFFNTALSGGLELHNMVTPSPTAAENAPVVQRDIDQLREQAMQIKNPQLRKQALDKLNRQTQGIEDLPQDKGASSATPKPVPNSKALNDMLAQVGQKLGVGATALGQSGLAKIAGAEKLATQTPATAATQGAQQTVGEAYQSFVKQLADPTTAARLAAGVVPLLEEAGLLDRNAASLTTAVKQANGTTFTNAQIANAYQQVLSTAVKNNQTQDQALTSLAQKGSVPNGPTSEMEAYVQGVATEFGVGLSTQQITEIANTYGQNAAVADNPATVADEIKDAVMALYDPTNPNNPAGVADTMFTNIKQAALQYQIPISDTQIGAMVKQDLQGATVQSVYATADAALSAATKQFQEQAQGLYPALSSQIAAGQTVQNLVSPYFNVAESITGVPASTMMADNQGGGLSKWSAFLQGGNNPAGATKANVAPGTQNTTGGPQMMTLDQWKTYLMQNPNYGFQNTQGAKDMAEQMTSAILNEFGKVNTLGGTSTPFNAYNGASDLSANRSSG